MEYRFVFAGRYFKKTRTLPGLNDYLSAERQFRNGHSLGNDMKRDFQALISNSIRVQLKRLCINKPVYIRYRYYEADKRRDMDNIAGVAHKFIQDALVQCRVIKDDGWSCIKGYSDDFFIDKKNPRIEVTLVEVGDT